MTCVFCGERVTGRHFLLTCAGKNRNHFAHAHCCISGMSSRCEPKCGLCKRIIDKYTWWWNTEESEEEAWDVSDDENEDDNE